MPRSWGLYHCNSTPQLDRIWGFWSYLWSQLTPTCRFSKLHYSLLHIHLPKWMGLLYRHHQPFALCQVLVQQRCEVLFVCTSQDPSPHFPRNSGIQSPHKSHAGMPREGSGFTAPWVKLIHGGIERAKSYGKKEKTKKVPIHSNWIPIDEFEIFGVI